MSGEENKRYCLWGAQYKKKNRNKREVDQLYATG